MIAIIDYGVGNLFSLRSSLAAVGAQAVVTGDTAVIRSADKLILPGVGAFADAAELLRSSGLDQVVCDEARLGMQLLLEESLEYGRHTGLGLIPGTVAPIRDVIPASYKVPHIGWNALHFPKNRPVHPLFSRIKEGDCVYFVHSYYGANCSDSVIATAEYGPELTAAVARDNVMGVQFHPEKSGAVGLAILAAFCEGKGADLC